MSIWGGYPQPGDWVQTTVTVPVTITDHLVGHEAGIPRGAKGVVLTRTGSRVCVSMDAGWGTQRVTLNSRDCQVVRRDGGVEAFQRRTAHLTAVRIGLALVLAYPVFAFIVQYVWATHGVHGLAGALATGAVQSILDMVTGFLAHPIKSVVYLAVVSVMTHAAFGPRRR